MNVFFFFFPFEFLRQCGWEGVWALKPAAWVQVPGLPLTLGGQWGGQSPLYLGVLVCTDGAQPGPSRGSELPTRSRFLCTGKDKVTACSVCDTVDVRNIQTYGELL